MVGTESSLFEKITQKKVLILWPASQIDASGELNAHLHLGRQHTSSQQTKVET